MGLAGTRTIRQPGDAASMQWAHGKAARGGYIPQTLCSPFFPRSLPRASCPCSPLAKGNQSQKAKEPVDAIYIGLQKTQSGVESAVERLVRLRGRHAARDNFIKEET